MDAATTEDNPLGTPYFLTKKDDALVQAWKNPTYVNPPFGRGIYEWVRKAYIESVLGTLVVMLIPARTDTKWFHTYIYNRPKVEYKFMIGRLRFYDYGKHEFAKHVAPFPSMVVIFRP